MCPCSSRRREPVSRWVKSPSRWDRALRHPAGPLPADPRDDEKMPAELQALKQEAERRLAEWQTTGSGLVSSSLYDACAWFSTGLGDHHSHDAQIAFIPCAVQSDCGIGRLNVDTAQYFDDASKRLAPDAETHDCAGESGAAAQRRRDPSGKRRPRRAPGHSHELFRRPPRHESHDRSVAPGPGVVAHWPAHRKIGPLMVPPLLAQKHGYQEGAAPSDALLEDLALHFSLTVYHLTCTCRIGSVVDPRLRVMG